MRRSGRVAAVLAVLLSLVLCGQALGDTWGPSVKVSDDPGDFLTYDRALATASGVTHVAYLSGGLRYRRSTNLGGTWSGERPIQADTDTLKVSVYAIAAYGTTVAVVYRARNAGANTSYLYLRRSLDKGLTWLPRQTVASYVSAYSMGWPAVAVASSGIHVTWTDRRDGTVYYRRSIDGGDHFLARVPLGVTTHAIAPNLRDGWAALAASGGRVYVAWSPATDPSCDCGVRLVMRRSTDGGASFELVQTVDSRPQLDFPALAASGATFLATYTLSEGGRVAIARSVDGGAMFTRKVVATSGTSWFMHGDVFLAGDSAYLAYTADNGTNGRVLLRRSADGGATWTPAEWVATAASVYPPSVVGTATAALVAWSTANRDTGATIAIFTKKRGT